MGFFWNVATWCLAHWKLNDSAANTTVVDSRGNYNGTASKNTSTFTGNGILNKAFVFDGTSGDEITTSSSCGIASTDIITVIGWVYPTSTPASNDGLIIGQFKQQIGGSGWQIAITDDGDITPGALVIVNQGGILTYRYKRSSELSQTGWSFFAVVLYPDNTNPKIYINGVDDTQGGAANGTITRIYQYSDVHIGYSAGSSANGLIGSTDNIAIFNRELLSDEILKLYNSGYGTESLLSLPKSFHKQGDAIKRMNRGVSNLPVKEIEEMKAGIDSTTTSDRIQFSKDDKDMMNL